MFFSYLFTCGVCVCNDIKELFIDETFKGCRLNYFQVYGVHGCKNENYLPFSFGLLPSTTNPVFYD